MDPSLEKKKKLLDNYTRYTSIAFQMLVIILIGVFGGIKLDEWLNFSLPVFTVIFSVLAVILSIYTVTRDLLKSTRGRDKKNDRQNEK
jgi:F0F1-type ATP synthase assembly protein I